MGVTGTPEQPSRVGISAADIATGMYALSGCLGALLRRATTGQGTHVEIAMLDALGEWMGSAMNHAMYGKGSPERRPSSHPALAPYGVHPCADGQILFGIQNDREWAIFCEKVLARPDIATHPHFHNNPARVANRDALDATIHETFGTLTADAVEARLLQAGIAFGRVRDAKEAAQHPQYAARNRWQEVQTPNGPIQALAPVWTMDGQTLPLRPVPALGEHTEEIMAEIASGTAAAAE